MLSILLITAGVVAGLAAFGWISVKFGAESRPGFDERTPFGGRTRQIPGF